MSGARRPRRRGTLLPALLAALLAVLGPAACQSSEHETGPDLERMVDQPRFDAYEATDLFADGAVMRTPPEGTLPFGPVAPAAVRTGLDAGAAPLADIPLPLTTGLLERGREAYGVYCAPCHGEDGNALTPVAAVMELRAPPSLHGSRIRGMAAGTLFRTVTEGYGMMPGYGVRLEPEERWAVVAYVRALQLSRRLPVDSLPAAERARVLERLDPAGAGGGR